MAMWKPMSADIPMPSPPWEAKDKPHIVKQAIIARDRKVYAFKREFFLTVAASNMAIEKADERADEAIAILFPLVTPENAAEYLNRA